MKLTDELLMAYADGELEEKQAGDIRKAIENDSEALKRVELFKESAVMLRGVYDAPLRESVPERLIETVMSSETGKPAPRLLQRMLDVLRIPARFNPAYALVASIALLIGAGAGYIATRTMHPISQPVSPALNGEGFSRGLETTASGQAFALADRGVEVMPVTSFLDKSNRYCRQYDVLARPEQRQPISQGVACRNKSGRWQSMVYINPLPVVSSTTETTTGFVPAGEEELASIISSQIMAAPPMTLERESELIERGWAGTADSN